MRRNSGQFRWICSRNFSVDRHAKEKRGQVQGKTGSGTESRISVLANKNPNHRWVQLIELPDISLAVYTSFISNRSSTVLSLSSKRQYYPGNLRNKLSHYFQTESTPSNLVNVIRLRKLKPLISGNASLGLKPSDRLLWRPTLPALDVLECAAQICQ